MKFRLEGEHAGEYDLVVEGLTFAEARAVEKTGGESFAELMENPALRQKVDVLQALLWVSMKRKQPTLTYSDLDDIEIASIVFDDPDEATPDADPLDPAPGVDAPAGDPDSSSSAPTT